ncbi:hypothetical protein FRC01_006496, partial [Tulasnella sp. 417]
MSPTDHMSIPRSLATVDADSSDESGSDDAISDVETTSRSRSTKATERREDLHDVISKN